MKKIKKFIRILILLLCCHSLQAQYNYTITGNITGSAGLKIYLKDVTLPGTNTLLDSVVSVNDQFSFKGKYPQPYAYFSLAVEGKKGGRAFIMEPGVIHIKGYSDSLIKSIISGSIQNDLRQQFQRFDDSLRPKYNESIRYLSQAEKNNDSLSYWKGLSLNQEWGDELTKNVDSTVYYYPSSFAALIKLNQRIGVLSPEKGLLLLRHFTPELQKHPMAIQMKEDCEARISTGIGRVAPAFRLPDANGKNISLNQFRGKYVLIDFWASWCVPCRKENPNIVKTYQKYHDKNFDIVSISLDRPNEKDKWLKAIADDGLSWSHVSELKYWQDPTAKKYAVKSIPANFLIDPQGRIIEKNLRGERLEQILEKIMAK